MASSEEIPVNSLSRHMEPLLGRLAEAMSAVMRSGHFVLGPAVRAFEQSFAEYCGAPYCVGVGNGTDAIELSLKAVGVGEGDRVALVANAAMYGTTAVHCCRAEPVYVDVLPEAATMDPLQFQAICDRAPDIKAVIVTHLYGRLAAIDRLGEIARAHGIAIVEDCAQAHGARSLDGRRAGVLGDVASFSFYPTKNLGALGDAGAVVTRSAEIDKRVRELRQYGWSGKYLNSLSGGRNSRLDELQAGVLDAMLPELDRWNIRRREIANRYSHEIRNIHINVPAQGGEDYVAHLYVVRTPRRDDLRAHLAALGIQTDVHYPRPDHRQPCHHGAFDSIDLPVTERDADMVVTLPCFPELTDVEIRRVIDACNRF